VREERREPSWNDNLHDSDHLLFPRDMHRDLCEGKKGLCDTMKPTKGTTLLQYLRKVDFEGER